MARYPRTQDSISTIRATCPQVIELVVDIGVEYKTGYLIDSCSDLLQVLVEPCDIYAKHIQVNYQGIDYIAMGVAASREDSLAYLVNYANDPSKPTEITHSTITTVKPAELPPRALAIKEIESRSVESILSNFPEIGQDGCLLKVDVDGIEMDILRGIKEQAPKIGVLIVEATLQTITEKITVASDLCMDLFDITDPGYYYGMLTQVELVFVSRNLKHRFPWLDPWKATNGALHPDHWQHV